MLDEGDIHTLAGTAFSTKCIFLNACIGSIFFNL